MKRVGKFFEGMIGRMICVIVFLTAISSGISVAQPSVLSVTPNLSNINEANIGTDAFNIVIVFSEDMDVSTDPTITFDPSVSTLTDEDGSWTNSTTYTVVYDVVDGNEELTGVDIQVGGAQNDAPDFDTQNPDPHIEVDALNIDNLRPDVVIGSGEPDPTSANPILITFEWDEDVTGFAASDVIVSGATKGALNAIDGDSYTMNLTPSSGEVDITVDIADASGSIVDGAGNPNNVATQFTIEHDAVQPTVTISSTEPDPTNADPIVVDIVFSEPVTGFVEGDISVTGGTKSGFSGSGATYSFNLNPNSSEESLTVDVAAGVATDGVNTNAAATQFTIEHDAEAPDVDNISSTASDPTTVSPIPILIEFSEAVSGLTAGEVDVTGASKGAITAVGGEPATDWTIDLTPNSLNETVTVDIPAGVATDGLNTNTAFPSNFSIDYDGELPTITSLEYLDATHLRVHFSEDVDETTAEVIGNYSLDNGISISTADWNNGNDDDVRLTVSNMSALLTGSVTVEVTVSNVEDEAGNAILPSSTSSVLLPDEIAPTIISIDSVRAYDNDQRVYVFVTFSEPAYDNASTSPLDGDGDNDFDVTVTVDDPSGIGFHFHDTKAWNGASFVDASGGETHFRLDLHTDDDDPRPSFNGNTEIQISEDGIYDAAGNQASGALTGSFGFPDEVGPFVNSTTVAADNSYVDIEFSEDVYAGTSMTGGLTTGDFSILFNQNGGNATGVTVTSIKTGPPGYTTDPVGGEREFRLFISVSNPPADGMEQITVQPFDDTSWYDENDNPAIKADIVTPVKNLNDLFPPTLSSVVLATNNSTGNRAREGDEITLSFTASETLGGDPAVVFRSGGDLMHNSVSIDNSGAPNYVATIVVDNLTNETDGAVTYTVDFADDDGNPGVQVTSGSGSVTVDNTKPTISNIVFSDPVITENDLTQTVTVSFDEPMQTSVDPSISVSGANWMAQDNSVGWIDPQTFEASFTHDGTEEEITVNVSVALDEVLDLVGNGNVASGTFNFNVDTQKPTADITYSDLDGYVRQGEILTITATFDEPMGSAPSISLTAPNLLSATPMSPTGDPTIWTYDHTVGAGDGTVTVSLSVGTDVNGNETNSAPNSGATFIVDNTAPTLVSYAPTTSTFPQSHNLPVNQQFVVEFSEHIIGMGTGNINVRDVSGTDNFFDAVSTPISGGDNEFATISPTLTEATEYEILLSAGSFVDRAGNTYAGNAGVPWNNLTTFGAPVIDNITATSLCIGSDIIVTGKYLTGVSQIIFRGGAGAGDDDEVDAFTIDNDGQITLTVPLLALPGPIDFIKENGQVSPAGAPANGGDRNTLSNSIIVGPSQADVILDPGGTGGTVCSEGVTNTGIQFTIQGGVGPYQVTYTEAGVVQGPITYSPGQIIDVNPPNNGANVYELTNVTDANGCAVPSGQLGDLTITEIETTKITINPVTNPQNPVCLSSVGGTIDLTGTVTGDNQDVVWSTTNGTGTFTSVDNTGPAIDATYNFTPQDYALSVLTIRVTSTGSTAPCSEDFDEIDITFTLNRSVDLGPNQDICYDSGGPNVVDLSGVLGGDADQGTWNAITFPANPLPGGDGLWILNGGPAGPNPGTIGDAADGAIDGTMDIQYVLSANDIANGGVTIELAPSGGSCGTPITGSIDINVTVLPAPTVISQIDNSIPADGIPDHEICSGETVVAYEVNNPSMSAFTWTIIDAPDGTSGTITSGQGTSKIFVDWEETATTGQQVAQVQVIENASNGCDSDPVLIDVIINPRPDVTFTPLVTNFSLDAAPIALLPNTSAGDPEPDKVTTFGEFSGTGVVKDPNDDYFFNPGIAGITGLHAITYTFTDANGCVNSATPVDFSVFDASDAIIGTASGLPIEDAYCADAPAFTIELSASFLAAQLNPGFAFSRFDGPGITDNGDQQTAELTPSDPFDLTLGGAIEIEYFQINTIAPFQEVSFGTQTVIINPVPIPTVTGIQDGVSYCTDNGIVPLTRDLVLNPTTDPGASFLFEVVGGDPEGLIENPAAEQYQLNPANAQFAPDDFTAKTITIRYYYINGNGCDDETFLDVNIYQQPPAPTVPEVNVCFTGSNNTLEVVDPVDGATITWYASDGLTVLESGTSPTFQPAISQSNLVEYFVSQEINNCESPATKISVGQIADPQFEHRGICVGSATNFEITSDLTGITELVWTITDANGDMVSQESLTGAAVINTYSFAFTTEGRYDVSLEFKSAICEATISNPIFVVPSVVVTTQYLEDFEGSSGWVPWGSDTPVSSWENAAATGTNISGGSRAWITNADGAFPSNELSFVYSPCFDISGVSRPMISFDIFSDMRSSAGVVLQYSTDGRFGTWRTIGSDNTGIEWYDERGLENVPGGTGTNVFAYGWSAEDAEWRNARHPLDDIPVAERSQVIFRIAFNSGGNETAQKEGFAFDNFRISEKYRLVVLEHFESVSDNSQPLAIEAEETPETEMVALQYRTNLGGNDDLFVSEVNARLEYYGFTSAPRAIFDGVATQETDITDFYQSTFTFRSLVEPKVDIDVTVPTPDGHTLMPQATITAREDITDPFLVHMAIVEKDAKGFKNVVRKLLPNAGGAKYSSLATTDAAINVEYDWLITDLSSDELDLAVVVFIQDEQTKEVLQAAYQQLEVIDPAKITDLDVAEENTKLYPNPADGYVNVVFSNQDERTVAIYDQFGKMIANRKVEQQEFRINTSEYASGVYFLQSTTQTGQLKRFKFVVSH